MLDVQAFGRLLKDEIDFSLKRAGVHVDQQNERQIEEFIGAGIRRLASDIEANGLTPDALSNIEREARRFARLALVVAFSESSAVPDGLFDKARALFCPCYPFC